MTRTAVMRMVVDPDGSLAAEAYTTGVQRLRERGIEVVATPAERLPDTDREIELILAAADLGDADRWARLCAEVFRTPVTPGVVTFISRGTDDDAYGVLSAFDITGGVQRSSVGEDELVTVTLSAAELGKVFEGRLHTALEAALNCEVRIVVDQTDALH